MPAEISELTLALAKALGFLLGNQLPTGQFKTFGSPDPNLKVDLRVVDEVFSTTFVLYTLLFAPKTSNLAAMISKALAFLRDQESSPGVWRYWTRLSNGGIRRKRGLVPVWNPPDVEDTALASLVLEKNGISRARNRGLLLANRRRDGLFYTWIVPRPQYPRSLAYWQVILPQYLRLHQLSYYWKFSGARRDDIDGGINANVVLYLGVRKETQAALDFLVDTVMGGREASCCKWYREPFSIRYFISRIYLNSAQPSDALRETIVARVQDSIQDGDAYRSALEVAMGVSTCLNFHTSPPFLHEAVAYLLGTQREDGSWPRHALYGRAGGWSFGSEEITTGACIEALARYKTSLDEYGP